MIDMALTHQVMELVLISIMLMIYSNTSLVPQDLIMMTMQIFLVHFSIEMGKKDQALEDLVVFLVLVVMMTFSRKVLEVVLEDLVHFPVLHLVGVLEVYLNLQVP